MIARDQEPSGRRWIIASAMAFTVMALVALLFSGCGGDPTDPAETPPPAESTTGPVCPETEGTFSADICPNRLDIGACSWALPGGRTLHRTGCITSGGITCVALAECPR